MVNVDIDEQLYNEIKGHVKQNKLQYPSIKFFVQKATLTALDGEKEETE